MSDQGGTPAGRRRGVVVWLLPVAAVAGLALGAGAVTMLVDDDSTTAPTTTVTTSPSPSTTAATTTTLLPPVSTTVPPGSREVGRYKGTTDIRRTPAFNVGSTWAVLATVAGEGEEGFRVDVLRAGEDPATATPVESISGGTEPVFVTLSEGGRFVLSITSDRAPFEVLVLDLPG